jgi:hypothetical protein
MRGAIAAAKELLYKKRLAAAYEEIHPMWFKG